MAKKSIDYISKSNDLLVNCGEGHVQGIIDNIKSDPRIKSIERVYKKTPVYEENISIGREKLRMPIPAYAI